jgi:RNA polymerase sigma factor (sigma-70 family)
MSSTCCIKGCSRPVLSIGLCNSHYVNIAQRYRDEQITSKCEVARCTIPVGLMLWVRDDPKYHPRRSMHLYTDDDIGTLRRAIKKLSHRQRLIIRLRFGIDDRCAMTLSEIGQKLKLSRERVRQIETRALLTLHWHMTRSELAWETASAATS